MITDNKKVYIVGRSFDAIVAMIDRYAEMMYQDFDVGVARKIDQSIKKIDS